MRHILGSRCLNWVRALARLPDGVSEAGDMLDRSTPVAGQMWLCALVQTRLLSVGYDICYPLYRWHCLASTCF